MMRETGASAVGTGHDGPFRGLDTLRGMTERGTAFPPSDQPVLARDFIPASHRGLPMLRVYLPFRDPARELGQDVVRWSDHVDLETLSASVDWYEATDPVVGDRPAVRTLVSGMGVLDGATADALSDVIGDVSLRCLRWVGYGEVAPTPAPASAPERVFGEDYVEADLSPDDVVAERRIPEFAWDAEGRLAWGGRLYPDSLIVAAELPLFRRLHTDPRLDTVSVRPERDVLPGSAGD